MKRSAILLLNPVIALFFLIGLAAMQPDDASGQYLLDTFTDDTAGSAPNGPEIGSGIYGGTDVSHTIVNLSGSQRLLSKDGSAATPVGILISYFPTTSSEVFQVSYEMRVERGASLVGLNQS